jgi:hypothetical protein
LGKARAVAAIPALIQLLSDDTPVEQPVCEEKETGAAAEWTRQRQAKWQRWPCRKLAMKLSSHS